MDKLHSAKLFSVLVCVLINCIVLGCAGPSETPTSTVSSPLSPLETPSAQAPTSLPTATQGSDLTLEPESGGAKGTLVAFPQDWGNEQVYVYFAPFTSSGEAEDEGFFVLEPSVHPRAEVRPDGYFQLDDIPPGRYVVVVGPNAQDALPVRQQSRPRIFDVDTGRIINMGQIRVER